MDFLIVSSYYVLRSKWVYILICKKNVCFLEGPATEYNIYMDKVKLKSTSPFGIYLWYIDMFS
jgi:hypothetical protein